MIKKVNEEWDLASLHLPTFQDCLIMQLIKLMHTFLIYIELSTWIVQIVFYLKP